MKNTVDAAAFYKAMTALMEVPSKSSIEVLREIRAEFTGDRCVLSATDLDTWMSVTITAVGDSFDFLFRNSANIQKAINKGAILVSEDGTMTVNVLVQADAIQAEGFADAKAAFAAFDAQN